MATPSPVITPNFLPPPSSRARELGRDLATLIRDFQREHPGMRIEEIRQAIRLAELETDAGVGNYGLAVGFVLAVICLGLALAFVML